MKASAREIGWRRAQARVAFGMALMLAALGTAPAAERPDAASATPRPATRLAGFYAGVRGGQSQTGQRSALVERDLAEAGTPAIAGVDRSSASWSLYAGCVLTPVLAIEAGYTDLGAYDLAVVAAPGNDTAALTRHVASLRPAAGDAVYAAARFDSPHFRGLHLQPRVGAFYWRDTRHYRLDDLRVGGDRDGFGLLLGASLVLDVGAHFSLGAGADLYRPTHDEGVRVLSGQIEYRF